MTLVKNGTIIDGTGKRAFVGDVLIDGERIADIAETINCLDATTIDAKGKLVTPGFIDVHSHSDAYLILEPSAPSKISQGITTEVNGQCGGSIAPRYGEARLSSDWASLLGDKLTWRSLAEYREVFDVIKPAINSVQFIGHNTLRSSVVGYAACEATVDDMKRMTYLLERSLDEGGWGLTTGLIYQPGKYSTSEEVTALARVTASKGGYYATHMRSEGDAILEAIDEVIKLVKASNIRAEISHLKTSGRRNWHKLDAVLDKMDDAVEKGLLLGSDRYPFCAAGTDLDVVLPDWAQEGAALGEMKRLKDRALRERIVAELDSAERDWSEVMIGGTWHKDTKRFSGKRISEIADKGVGETICSILEKDLCRTGAFFFTMSEKNLDQIYSRSWVLAGSDASLRAPTGPLGEDYPHPRAYSTMPEFYRRVRALGFSREATIARMTGDAAKRFGIHNRGVLEKGAFADIVIWDENAFRSTATYAKPHSFTEGIVRTFVNGELGHGKFLER